MELNEILKVAIKGGASDIHLKSGLPPMFRVDGALVPLKNGERILPDDLQKIALDMLEERFKSLIERGVVAPIDPRALVVFLISSFSMWHVSARLKKSWMNPPYLDTPEGRARSERYFITTFERLLGVEEDASASRAGD